MRYYCSVCKKTITKAEFLYSIDKFDKALCRTHQQSERETRNNQSPKTSHISESQDHHKNNVSDSPIENTQSKKGFTGLLKKVAITTSKGIVKGAKKIAASSKKAIQIRRWKDDVLRRMTMSQLKRICFEQRVDTKKSVLKENQRSGEFYWKEYQCTKEELVSRIKNNVHLETITAFAKRNHVNIRDILRDIEQKKSEWRVKQITEEIHENGEDRFLELEKAIREFSPLRRYYQEILYQDSLASWLKSKYPDTAIEIQRGSSRPDIVVNNIAIEIKGPTSQRDLDSIPSKCMRYSQHFNQRVIVVLFDVQVGQRYYQEWEKGLKKTYPEAIVIRK